jgi:hypothetical protein
MWANDVQQCEYPPARRRHGLKSSSTLIWLLGFLEAHTAQLRYAYPSVVVGHLTHDAMNVNNSRVRRNLASCLVGG